MADNGMLRTGYLPVSDGNELYYEVAGNRAGPAVLWLHGGPGSGTLSGYRKRINLDMQQAIGFDQRGCGRSRPLATDRLALLDTNTTSAQIADIEALRCHLGVEKWLITGVSWGSTLGLAYAQAHPNRVTGIALVSVTNTSTEEVEWTTEAMGRVFPEEWEQFSGVVGRQTGERIVDAYARALRAPDPVVRAVAARAWIRWEEVHVSLGSGGQSDPRWQDPTAREVFATLVTHYWSNSGFGGDDILDRMGLLSGIPGVLIHGRRDISSPAIVAWRVHKAWPGSELLLLDEGHGGPVLMAELAHTISKMAG